MESGRLKRWLISALCSMAWVSTACASDAGGVEWVTLGTGGGPVMRVERSQPANALVVGKSIYLFDVGNGVLRQLAAAKLNLEDVHAVFISHQHIDHNADIGLVLISRWLWNNYSPLPVIGAPGTVSLVHDVLAGYHATELAPITDVGPPKPSLSSTVRVEDIGPTTTEPVLVFQDANIKVWAVTNTHYHFPAGSAEQSFSRSYSFRIEAPGRTIVYTGDTGPAQSVQKLAEGADLLVSEVIDADRIVAKLKRANYPAAVLSAKIKHMQEDHLTPADVGALAAGAGVKEVVLTHIVPGDDGESDLSSYIDAVSDKFKGQVHLAKDVERF